MFSKLAKTSAALLAMASLSQAQGTIFVDAQALPGGNGSSWATAFNNLDSALSVAAAGNDLWVAAGTYKPRLRSTPGVPRSASFMPAPGVRLFGGFNGTETSLASRAGLFEQTILDGDIGVSGIDLDNAYHVLRLEGNGAQHTVNGFQIQNGYADGAGINHAGAGIYTILGTKKITNCFFVNNYALIRGAAIKTSFGGLIRIRECTFDGNTAGFSGGALYIAGRHEIWNSTFKNNSASNRGGAVVITQGTAFPDGSPKVRFQNCEFFDNSAARGGAAFLTNGGVTNTPGRASWRGCTFAFNTASSAGGAIGSPTTFAGMLDARLEDCILWGNRALVDQQITGAPGHYAVRYSDIQGGFAGPGNIQVNPSFVNVTLRQLDLRPGSPCIDAGDNSSVHTDFFDLDGDGNFVEATPLDLAGKRRFLDDLATPDTGLGGAPVVDMGAYEL